MTTEANKVTARRALEEMWNQCSIAPVDELFTEDYIGNFAVLPEPLRGREALKAFASAYFVAFPDIRFTIEDLFADGDRVLLRWTAQGTHTGPLMGIPPTGKHITVPGIWIHRFEGGKIAEEWGINDTLGMMRQLGVIPAPEPSHA